MGKQLAALAGTPGLRSITPAGSFRRRRETIGDLDLLAETDDPAALVARFTALPEVDAERIGCIGHSLGGHNTMFTAVFDNEPPTTMPPHSAEPTMKVRKPAA